MKKLINGVLKNKAYFLSMLALVSFTIISITSVVSEAQQNGSYQSFILTVNRQIRNENLPLRSLLRLGNQYANHSLSSVIVKYRNSTRNESFKLFRNSQQLLVMPDNNPSWNSKTMNLRYLEMLGSSNQEIYLQVAGGPIFVESVQVLLMTNQNVGQPTQPPPSYPGNPYDPSEPPYLTPGPNNPGRPPQMSYLNLLIKAQAEQPIRVSLGRYFDINRYRNYRLMEVIITGQARYQVSFVEFQYVSDYQRVNQSIQLVGEYLNSQKISFYSGLSLNSVRQLDLITKGQMYLDNVTLVLQP